MAGIGSRGSSPTPAGRWDQPPMSARSDNGERVPLLNTMALGHPSENTVNLEDHELMDESPSNVKVLSGGAHLFGDVGEGEDDGLDIVQFSNMFFYVVEGSGDVTLTAMRIGKLDTMCTVEFMTEDNSAKAGAKYKGTRGRIEFAAGQEFGYASVKILEDESFDTNLDFNVNLDDPIGCQLGQTLSTCRVVIIDDDVFPTNVYREEILKGNVQALGVQLLIAFTKFAIFRIPIVGFRTYINLFLDQLVNLNYLIGIWLNVYLVDIVLNFKDEDTLKELWVPNERLGTACLVGMAYIIPRALLTFIDYLKEGQLAVAGKVKLHLKVNLFRKYLYYNQASHAKVSAQELTKAMDGDIEEVVEHGFMVVFKLAQQIVKVAVILYFLIHKHPQSAMPLIIYPIAMAVVLNMRYETTLRLKDDVRDAEKHTMTCLRESCDDINLIKEYNMRSFVVNRYERSIKDQNPPGDRYAFYDFRTMLVMPWITNFAICTLMIVGGHYVLTGRMSLGGYLATINIYRDAGELFSGFYQHLKDCYGVVGPLLRIIRLLNLEGDVLASMEQMEERTKGMTQELQSGEDMLHSKKATSRFDMLHIKLMHASLSNDRGGPLAPALQDIGAEVEQGNMVAILGPHGAGKFSLLKLLTGLVKPKNGIVHVPTHLRCICVPNVPELFKNGNLVENLTFGTQGDYDKDRLKKICKAVGLGRHTMTCLDKELEAGGSKEHDHQGIPWYEMLSQSELLKMHITRAINLNPEVLLLHRPVDEMEADHAARILDVLRKHVDHRGLFTSAEQRATARPHTVFFTSGEDRERAESAADVADVVWHLSEQGFKEEKGGHANALEQVKDEMGFQKDGNHIVNSWSREVRSLEQNLAKAKHAHSAASEEAERHKADMDDLRGQHDQVKGQLDEVTEQARRALRDARAYEMEMAQWDTKQGGMCTARQPQPSPRGLSQALTDLVAAGEGRSRSTSPYPNQGVDPRNRPGGQDQYGTGSGLDPRMQGQGGGGYR